jgi:hypothetical protein
MDTRIARAGDFGPSKRPYTPRAALTPLQLRARRLLDRGFDVPPSRQREFDSLARTGLRHSEIREIMELE